MPAESQPDDTRSLNLALNDSRVMCSPDLVVSEDPILGEGDKLSIHACVLQMRQTGMPTDVRSLGRVCNTLSVRSLSIGYHDFART